MTKKAICKHKRTGNLFAIETEKVKFRDYFMNRKKVSCFATKILGV
jgi:hypothetical protein